MFVDLRFATTKIKQKLCCWIVGGREKENVGNVEFSFWDAGLQIQKIEEINMENCGLERILKQIAVGVNKLANGPQNVKDGTGELRLHYYPCCVDRKMTKEKKALNSIS
nr:hypothetical protein Iba_chr02aCG9130 [Ipomoea batatas]